MRTDGKYRFTLQFSADTEVNAYVGEVLEALGNRKSSFIITAVAEYLNAHPEQAHKSPPHDTAVMLTKADVRKLIMAVLKEINLPAASPSAASDTATRMEQQAEVTDQQTNADIDAMLRNLNVFK